VLNYTAAEAWKLTNNYVSKILLRHVLFQVNNFVRNLSHGCQEDYNWISFFLFIKDIAKQSVRWQKNYTVLYDKCSDV
jgi:hypothetical protein